MQDEVVIIGKELNNTQLNYLELRSQFLGKWYAEGELHVDKFPASLEPHKGCYLLRPSGPTCFYRRRAHWAPFESSEGQVLFPAPRCLKVVVCPDEDCVYPYSSPFRIKKSVKSQKCIGFKALEGHQYYIGFWYCTTKILVVNANVSMSTLQKIMEFLEGEGLVAQLPPPPKSTDEETTYIAELHYGKVEVIEVPIKPCDIKVGCDPEFEVLNSGIVVLPPPQYKCNLHGEIGADGAGLQLELRPKAGSPQECVDNIAVLMKKVAVPITTIGNAYPLGGHIHVGVGRKISPPDDLLSLLDYFVGRPTINLSGTARAGYKKYGTFEQKPWGFEYRTPPAAIFWKPRFAYLAMKACECIVRCYNNGQTLRLKPSLVVNNTPCFEDYANYAGFTEQEYNEWLTLIDSYAKWVVTATVAYQRNIASYWDATVSPSTNFSLPCDCGQKNCRECNPDYEMYLIEEQAYEEHRERELWAEHEAEARRREIARRHHAFNQAARLALYARGEALGICFSDTWSCSHMDAWLTAIEDARRETENALILGGLSELTSRQPETLREPICLFGLAAERGMSVSGFNCRHFLRRDIRTGTHTYGIPKCLRFEGTLTGETMNNFPVVNAETKEMIDDCVVGIMLAEEAIVCA